MNYITLLAKLLTNFREKILKLDSFNINIEITIHGTIININILTHDNVTELLCLLERI